MGRGKSQKQKTYVSFLDIHKRRTSFFLCGSEACIYACIHVYMYQCMFVQMKVKGQPQVSLHVCICTCLYVSVHVCPNGGQRSASGIIPQEPLKPVFYFVLRQSLTGTQSSSICLGWLAGKPQGFTYFHLPRSRITNVCTTLRFLFILYA